VDGVERKKKRLGLRGKGGCEGGQKLPGRKGKKKKEGEKERDWKAVPILLPQKPGRAQTRRKERPQQIGRTSESEES